MGKRVCLMIDEDLVIKLHKEQAKFIKEYKDSISFSNVLNEILRKGLK
jgi:hypothetical protein